MPSHRRKKRAKNVIKNLKKLRTWWRRTKKRVKTRWQAFDHWGERLGRIHCTTCDKWIHQDWMAEHIEFHEKNKKKGTPKTTQKPVDGAKPQTTWGPWKRLPNQQQQGSTVAPVAPPQKQTPTANPQKKQTGSQNRPKLTVVKDTQKQSGGNAVAPTGTDEGTETPHAGHEAVIEFFNRWSQAYPSNFEVNHQDAEILGEMWHAVADAYNRKCQMLVEDNHFPPSIVEPYEMIAKMCGDMADHHKDMADRTQSTFGTLIEAMSGPVPRDTNFAKPR